MPKRNPDRCPYRNIELIVRTSLTYYCGIVGKELCISQESLFKDYEECSYYLFPEPLCKHYDKKECEKWVNEESERCPCFIFESIIKDCALEIFLYQADFETDRMMEG